MSRSLSFSFNIATFCSLKTCLLVVHLTRSRVVENWSCIATTYKVSFPLQCMLRGVCEQYKTICVELKANSSHTTNLVLVVALISKGMKLNRSFFINLRSNTWTRSSVEKLPVLLFACYFPHDELYDHTIITTNRLRQIIYIYWVRMCGQSRQIMKKQKQWNWERQNLGK